MTTNVLVRDFDLAAPHVDDARRLEVVVDMLPLFGGAQLVVDTTLVSALRADGSCRRRAAQHDGLAAEAARLKRREPILNLWGPTAELTAGHARPRLSSPSWHGKVQDDPHKL